jgi:site-specific DNA recombinase
MTRGNTTLRTYYRRSRDDHQHYSIDGQRDGAKAFVTERLAALLGSKAPSWGSCVEYVDDESGGVFAGRVAINRLIEESRPGDIVVCRSQCRLGRDVIETPNLLRELLEYRGVRLFYYETGVEERWDGIAQKMMAILGTFGPAYERDAIRSRTREALRRRVALGRVAGGVCYGYMNERRKDEAGREYTVQSVAPEQARVVKRIFEMKVAGHGYRDIAKTLNDEGVPKPKQGKRGTGSWSLAGVRTIIVNERYRGIVIHGREVKTDFRGERKRVRAQPGEVMHIEAPHLRIVADELWFAAQPESRTSYRVREAPNRQHPLSGVGRCAVCGGPMSIRSSRTGKTRKLVYACSWHRNRGDAVCANKLMRSKEEVEEVVFDYLRQAVLTEETTEAVIREVRDRLQAKRKVDEVGLRAMQKEALKLGREIARLVDAIAVTPDSRALQDGLRQRESRLRTIEQELEIVRRAPGVIEKELRQMEKEARERLADLHGAFEGHPEAACRLMDKLFPRGLLFEPVREEGQRPYYRLRGEAVVESCVLLGGVPSGNLTVVNYRDYEWLPARFCERCPAWSCSWWCDGPCRLVPKRTTARKDRHDVNKCRYCGEAGTMLE